MASIQKISNSGYWYASYRDATKRQHLVSTKVLHTPAGATVKERADRASENRRLALEVSLRLEEQERGNAVESHLRKILSDVSQRVNKRRLQFAATETFLRDWIIRAELTKSSATATRYKGTVEGFLENLGPKAKGALADITPQDVQQYAQLRLQGGRNPTTVQVDLKTLNAPFALALKQGLILSNPVPSADIPKAEKEPRSPFTISQLKALIREANGEWKTAIMLGLFTGARLGDCTSMTWAAVDFVNGTIRFRPQKTKRSKRDLELPIHHDLEKHLLTLPGADQPAGHLCPDLSQAQVGGRSGLSRQFQSIMAAAGIAQDTVAAGGPSGRMFNRLAFHSLRHSYISILANAGVPEDVRKLLAGHSDEKSHARYTHTEFQVLQKAIQHLPQLT